MCFNWCINLRDFQVFVTRNLSHYECAVQTTQSDDVKSLFLVRKAAYSYIYKTESTFIIVDCFCRQLFVFWAGYISSLGCIVLVGKYSISLFCGSGQLLESAASLLGSIGAETICCFCCCCGCLFTSRINQVYRVLIDPYSVLNVSVTSYNQSKVVRDLLRPVLVAFVSREK